MMIVAVNLMVKGYDLMMVTILMVMMVMIIDKGGWMRCRW